jgi:hypothetical protein
LLQNERRKRADPWPNRTARSSGKAYDDFSKGNVPAVFAVFDAAITWHVPGHGPLSGDYTGHAQVGGFFQCTMVPSQGAFGIVAESQLTQTLFRQILGRLERLAWHPT